MRVADESVQEIFPGIQMRNHFIRPMIFLKNEKNVYNLISRLNWHFNLILK